MLECPIIRAPCATHFNVTSLDRARKLGKGMLRKETDANPGNIIPGSQASEPNRLQNKKSLRLGVILHLLQYLTTTLRHLPLRIVSCAVRRWYNIHVQYSNKFLPEREHHRLVAKYSSSFLARLLAATSNFSSFDRSTSTTVRHGGPTTPTRLGANVILYAVRSRRDGAR